jgi:subfamily B ATP-binding cassette protein MsbA
MKKKLPDIAPDASTLMKIWGLIRPYTTRVFVAIFFSLVVSGMDGAIAWLVKPAMDHIFVEKQYQYIMFLPAGVFILYLVRGGAGFLQAYYMKTAGFRLVRDLRNIFFKNLAFLPITTIFRSSSGDMVSRQMNDVGLLSKILSECLRTFLVQIPTAVVLMGVALYRRWDLAILTFLLFPFIAYGTKKFSRYTKKKRKKVQKYMAKLTHRINEMVTGIKIIKTFGMEKAKISQFRKENQVFYRHNAKIIMLKEGTQYLIDMISGLSMAIILGYGGYLVANGKMTSGDFFSIIAATAMLFSPIKRIGSAYNTFQESLGVLERVENVLHLPREPAHGIKTRGLNKGIEFRSVSFSYNGSGEEVLKDINLFIPAGKVLAIVGPSGTGKSTFVDLIPRFITPTSGKIFWDEQDIMDMSPRELRKNIASVSQDIILFSDTIRENIAAGKNDLTINDIKRASKIAQAHDFIMSFPEQYEMMLKERGLNLSGGQRQRIALARAVLKDPPLLILDEATSALDTVSEQQVQKALSEVMKGRTTIVIAHRLSTVQNADTIAVMDKGRIMALGTHKELIEKDPTYRELYKSLEEGHEA